MITERIKTLRKALGLSQKDFGEELGTTRDVISNLEYGRVEPKPVFLDLICTIFNINPEWLKDGTGEIFNPSPEPNEELIEASQVFEKLTPRLQKYALQQIKGLLEVQQQEDKEKTPK